MYIYIYINYKPKTRCAGVILNEKNTLSILTNISVVLHNLLHCV